MDNKKIVVSVGIPAYNEQANIKNILSSILKQKADNFTIKEILVASDGSTDSTVVFANSLKNKKIKVLNNKDRKGKCYRLNQILSEATGELIFFVDADASLNNDSMEQMVNLAVKKPEFGVIVADITAHKPETQISKSLASGINVLNYVKKAWRNGDNVYSFRGCLVLLSKNFSRKLKFPLVLADDAFLYFESERKAMPRFFASKAKAHFSLPTTFQDHLKQSLRFKRSQAELQKIFGPDIAAEYQIPPSLMLRAMVKEFFTNPYYFSLYILINLFTMFYFKLNQSKGKKQNPAWEVAVSTK